MIVNNFSPKDGESACYTKIQKQSETFWIFKVKLCSFFVDCGPVNDIANGKIKSDNITIGSVATVICDTGYDATLPTVTCQVTGLWETVSCIPKGKIKTTYYFKKNSNYGYLYETYHWRIVFWLNVSW